MAVSVTAVPMLADNYSWLLYEPGENKLGIVDPAEAAPAIAAIEAAGGKLDTIFLTHHHFDHVGGSAELVARYGAKVVGNAADAERLPKLDIALREGEEVQFGRAPVRLIETPGHTIGHVAYYIGDGGLLFCGDTLFSLGCGKLFEGTAEDMYESLQKFTELPKETLVFAGHEYTQSNARFARSVDPDNQALQARAREVDTLREQGKASLPVSLGSEMATNPFLRALDPGSLLRLRTAKDNFR